MMHVHRVEWGERDRAAAAATKRGDRPRDGQAGAGGSLAPETLGSTGPVRAARRRGRPGPSPCRCPAERPPGRLCLTTRRTRPASLRPGDRRRRAGRRPRPGHRPRGSPTQPRSTGPGEELAGMAGAAPPGTSGPGILAPAGGDGGLGAAGRLAVEVVNEAMAAALARRRQGSDRRFYREGGVPPGRRQSRSRSSKPWRAHVPTTWQRGKRSSPFARSAASLIFRWGVHRPGFCPRRWP